MEETSELERAKQRIEVLLDALHLIAINSQDPGPDRSREFIHRVATDALAGERADSPPVLCGHRNSTAGYVCVRQKGHRGHHSDYSESLPVDTAHDTAHWWVD